MLVPAIVFSMAPVCYTDVFGETCKNDSTCINPFSDPEEGYYCSEQFSGIDLEQVCLHNGQCRSDEDCHDYQNYWNGPGGEYCTSTIWCQILVDYPPPIGDVGACRCE